MAEKKNRRSSLAVDAIMRIEGNNDNLLEKYLTQTNIDRVRNVALTVLFFMLVNLLDPKCWQTWYTRIGACLMTVLSLIYIIVIHTHKKLGRQGTKIVYLSYWLILLFGIFPFLVNDVVHYEQPMNCLIVCCLLVIIPVLGKRELTEMFAISLTLNELAALIGGAETFYYISVAALTIATYFIARNVQSNYIDALQTQENEKATLLDMYDSFPTGFAIAEISHDWHISKIYMSEKARKTLNYEDDELRGDLSGRFVAMIHPEDVERLRNEIKKCSGDSSNINCDLRLAHKNGGYHWLNLNASVAERNADNDIVIGVYTDIQKRKEAEIKADTMIRSIDGGFLVYEQNEAGKLQCKYLSDGFCRMLHIDEQKLEIFKSGTGIDVGVHPDDLEEVKKKYADALESGVGFKAAYRISGNGKDYIWCGVNASIYENEHGR